MFNKNFCLNCLLILVLMSVQCVYAQKVSGVVRHDGSPVEFCNVVVKNLADSTFISGTVTDTLGHFVLDKINEGSYFIEASCVGYKKQRVPFTVADSKMVHWVAVELSPNVTFLNEVTVIASQKIWKKTNNSLSMKVEGTPLADMISTVDVLAYMPGVMADELGIKLIGKDNLLILIDNRIVSSFSEVENLSVHSIKAVTLEKNAGVRYDSKYKSVLRITTKKRSHSAVEVSQRTKVGRKLSHTESANLYLEADKLTLNWDLVSNFRNDINHYDVEMRNRKNDAYQVSYQSIRNKRKGFDTSLGLKYEFGENHYLQLYDDFYYSGNKPTNKTATEYLERDVYEQIFTDIASHYNEKNNRLNLFYNQPLWKDSHLDLSLDYIYKYSEDKQAIRDTHKQKVNEFDIDYEGKYNVYLAQLNYSGTLGHLFEGNLGLNYMNLENKTLSYNTSKKANICHEDGEHKEQQFAYYLNLEKQINKFQLSVGIRNELVWLEYKNTNSSSKQEKRINSFFPFASLGINISPKWNLSLSYDRKMNLPSYQQLNPITTYYDRYSYGIGNPNLAPVYFNNLSLNTLYNNTLNFFVEYSFIKNYIQEVPMQDSSDKQVIKVMPINIASNYQISVGASLSKQFKRHRINLQSTLLAQKSKLADFIIDDNRFFFSFYTSVHYRYQLRKNIDFYLKLNYTGKTEDAICKQYPSFNSTVGMSCNFFDKRLQLNIAYDDIFHTKNSDFAVKYIDISNLQKNHVDSRIFSIHLKYIINKASHKQKIKSVDDILNRL